jgi:hypothetical protein
MDKKILLFCSSGPIDSEEKKLTTTAAFTSWKRFNFDVLFLGEEYHKELCDEYGFILDTQVEKDRGLPIIRNIFQKALSYPGYDYYCYINTDIILLEDINEFLNVIKKTEEEFCVVGQRINVYDLPPINFSKHSYDNILSIIYLLKKELYQHTGIDYFCFTPNFWDVNQIPDFRIARGFFDNWLINYGITEGNGKMIDLSYVFQPIHPEPNVRPKVEGQLLQDVIQNRIIGNSDKIRFQGTQDLLFYLDENLTITPRYL